ncbi:MAG: hypothetical protein ACE5OZ_25480 [Candidatus Heimdallarchaeota archaeon]
MAKSRPLGVTILGIIYWLYALFIVGFWFFVDDIVREMRDNDIIDQAQADAFVDASWILLVLALFFFLVGLGLFKLWNIARIVAVILAVFQLLAFPIGTIIGAIIIWYLLKGSTGDAFR